MPNPSPHPSQDPLAPLLPCYGCAHSVSEQGFHKAWPGRPSGETPCMVCVRNPKQPEDLASVLSHSPNFQPYGQPLDEFPKDLYIALDRLILARKA